MTTPDDEVVRVWTDGSYRPGSDCGGWAAILEHCGERMEICGGERNTTNNRMELLAAIRAIQWITEPCEVVLHSDSRYVVDGATQWLGGWVRRGWQTSTGSPVKNDDLWRLLMSTMQPHDIRWEWVRGHNGHTENERADQLATWAAGARFKPGQVRIVGTKTVIDL